ncbi:MAG: hypothetical protein Q9162_006495 [Coniocarpon cinnabarinum]
MANDRRTPGLSAFSRNTLTSAQYASHGNQLRQNHTQSLQTQLSVFQELLHQFSKTHAKDIKSNPQFRAEFARMCNAIGVDPLVSSNTKKPTSSENSGSFWAQMLGGSVNDFYFELAVRVVEVCRNTRSENGGIIAVSEVAQRVQKARGIGGGMEVSEDDVRQAVKALQPLSSGFAEMSLGAKLMIRSVPKELNPDQAVVLEAVQVLGYVTVSLLQVNLRWQRPRAKAVLEDLVEDSLLWVDTQADETEYWTPASIREPGVG